MAQIRRTPSRQATVPIQTPAPIRGLNTVDSLAMMDITYALSCQNWIAAPQGLEIRRGYRKWATGLPGATNTLIAYNARQSTSNKLFAVSGTGIYDVTSGGAVGAAVVTGLNASATYWQ